MWLQSFHYNMGFLGISISASLVLLPLVPYFALQRQNSSIETALSVWLYQILLVHLKTLYYKDYSHITEVWSPVVYCLVLKGEGTKGTVMACLVLLWSLSHNFYNRVNSEDYRITLVADQISSPVLWQCFHIGIMCVLPNLVSLLLCLPIKYTQNNLDLFDLLLISLLLTSIAVKVASTQKTTCDLGFWLGFMLLSGNSTFIYAGLTALGLAMCFLSNSLKGLIKT